MVSRTHQTAAVAALLNIPLTLDRLYPLLQDDVPAFKAELEQLPPAEKFQLLSYTDDNGDYLLHDVLYSLCNPERADIPGNDPDLIDCVLSGLTQEQSRRLFCLRNDAGDTPLSILLSGHAPSLNAYPPILQRLLTELVESFSQEPDEGQTPVGCEHGRQPEPS